MVKIKTKWMCQTCGYETASFLGKCPDCSSWSSFKEEVISAKETSKDLVTNFDSYIQPQLLKDIETGDEIRFSSGYQEFDRVLGNGITDNSLVLIGGDPGIGKSTLLLQVCGKLSEQGIKTLYVSAEESPKQLKLRADRLNINTENIYIFAQTNLNMIMEEAKSIEPRITIIDSIQAIYNPELSSSPGTISQLKECSHSLLRLAKFGMGAVFIVGHVTKDGAIAGPKVLEHLVDTVLYLEGDNYKTYRILRTVKNRYGNTNEIGIFSMKDSGLEEVLNPSELFLSQRGEQSSPGSSIIATIEGTRPILIEVQALVGPTSYPSPRRVATGIEYNRLLQIIAVLEKRVGLCLSKHDVYVSIVGGISIEEPCADLGIALAIVSSYRNISINNDTITIGEIGLTGEIRPVNKIDTRISESIKQGFKRIIIPSNNHSKSETNLNIETTTVERLIEAISKAIEK